MSLVHDIIKIQLVREGYLPNYPYHLISDEEMCDAFLNDSGTSYFDYYYPCVNNDLLDAYQELKSQMYYHIHLLKSSISEYVLPDWVYSYMLRSVISVHSDKADIHDMLVLMGMDNMDDIFTASVSARCYEISSSWVQKYSADTREHRPPSMFGELHVIKSLRIDNAKVG